MPTKLFLKCFSASCDTALLSKQIWRFHKLEHFHWNSRHPKIPNSQNSKSSFQPLGCRDGNPHNKLPLKVLYFYICMFSLMALGETARIAFDSLQQFQENVAFRRSPSCRPKSSKMIGVYLIKSDEDILTASHMPLLFLSICCCFLQTNVNQKRVDRHFST